MNTDELTPQEKYMLFCQYLDDHGYDSLIKFATTVWCLFVSVIFWLVISLIIGTVNVLLWAWYIQWLLLFIIAWNVYVGIESCSYLRTSEGRKRFFKECRLHFFKDIKDEN